MPRAASTPCVARRQFGGPGRSMSRPMRGFFGFLVLLLVALAIAALVIVPAIVRPMVVEQVRQASPFEQPIEVEVDVDPLQLLLGSIREIRVTGANLEAEGAIIGSLDLTLSDVSTGSRTWRSLVGRLSNVQLPFVQRTNLVIETIDLTGTDGSFAAS